MAVHAFSCWYYKDVGALKATTEDFSVLDGLAEHMKNQISAGFQLTRCFTYEAEPCTVMIFPAPSGYYLLHSLCNDKISQ